MTFPLGFWDIGLWIAVTAIILLATSELLAPYYGRTSLVIDRKRMRLAALALGIVFLICVAIRAAGIILFA